MKNQIKLFAVFAALVIGLTFNNVAGAVSFGNMTTTEAPAGFKVAVVDVGAVVAQSSEVKALKQEQEQKLQELRTWLETVRADVAKQQTKEGKEKLIKKYDADFAKKQESVRKEYAKKLQNIDKNISAIISEEARNQGYNMVFAKGTVLYGGTDITGSIVKRVK